MSIANTYIGRNAEDFKKSPSVTVDRVIVNTGSGSAFYSPSGLTDAQWYAMTGKIMSVTIPFGTQAIADNIRTTLSARSFAPYSATCSELDPAAELGDWATIGGVYSVIAKRTFYLDSLGTSDFSAETENEVTDKYPYISSVESGTERQLAELTSRLVVAEGNITSEVTRATAAEGTLSSRITQTETSITSEVTRATTAEGTLGTLIDQRLDGITLSVSGTSGTTTFQLKDGSTVLDTESFDLHVKSMNVEGTITADYVDASGVGTGTLYLGDSSTPGKLFVSGDSFLYGGIGLTLLAGDGGDMYLWTSDGGNCRIIAEGYVRLTSNSVVQCQALSLVPYSDGSCGMGYSNYRWGQIYSTSSTILTSDRNEKKDINYDIDDMDDFFDSIKPCSYKFINGTSNRTHYGMISQDVEDSLTSEGKTALDFAGFCKDKKTEPVYNENGEITGDRDTGEYRYGIRYEEFIALCISQIQKLKARVSQLEANIS